MHMLKPCNIDDPTSQTLTNIITEFQPWIHNLYYSTIISSAKGVSSSLSFTWSFIFGTRPYQHTDVNSDAIIWTQIEFLCFDTNVSRISNNDTFCCFIRLSIHLTPLASSLLFLVPREHSCLNGSFLPYYLILGILDKLQHRTFATLMESWLMKPSPSAQSNLNIRKFNPTYCKYAAEDIWTELNHVPLLWSGDWYSQFSIRKD